MLRGCLGEGNAEGRWRLEWLVSGLFGRGQGRVGGDGEAVIVEEGAQPREKGWGRWQQGRKCRGWSKRGTTSVCSGGFLFQGRERRLGKDERKGREAPLLGKRWVRVRVFFFCIFLMFQNCPLLCVC